MRWRRPRLTIRVVMFVILVIGLLLGGGIYARRLARRSAQYRRIASGHASIEEVHLGLITSEESMVRLWRNRAAFWAEVARHNSTLDPALDEFFPGLSRDNRNRAAEIEWDLQQSIRRRVLPSRVGALRRAQEKVRARRVASLGERTSRPARTCTSRAAPEARSSPRTEPGRKAAMVLDADRCTSDKVARQDFRLARFAARRHDSGQVEAHRLSGKDSGHVFGPRISLRCAVPGRPRLRRQGRRPRAFQPHVPAD